MGLQCLWYQNVCRVCMAVGIVTKMAESFIRLRRRPFSLAPATCLSDKSEPSSLPFWQCYFPKKWKGGGKSCGCVVKARERKSLGFADKWKIWAGEELLSKLPLASRLRAALLLLSLSHHSRRCEGRHFGSCAGNLRGLTGCCCCGYANASKNGRTRGSLARALASSREVSRDRLLSVFPSLALCTLALLLSRRRVSESDCESIAIFCVRVRASFRSGVSERAADKATREIDNDGSIWTGNEA